MKWNILLFALLVAGSAWAKDNKTTPQQYIDQFKSIAVREMKRTGIPASITLAQGMLESSYGNSKLARKANNHFGIKCHSDWTGPSMRKDDDKKKECFRKYKSAEHSYRDHSDFLTGKKRYAFLFDLKSTDYKGWAKGLKKAGYATNPKYPRLLIDLIDRYNLDQFDSGKIKKKKKVDTPKKKAKKKKAVVDEDAPEFDLVEVGGGAKVHLSGNLVRYVLVAKGKTIEEIAKEHKVTVARLMKYNELKSKKIKHGSPLYLQPKRNNAKKKFYTVKAGDSLYRISQKFAVTQKSLIRRNRLAPTGEVKAGQRLKLAGSKIKK